MGITVVGVAIGAATTVTVRVLFGVTIRVAAPVFSQRWRRSSFCRCSHSSSHSSSHCSTPSSSHSSSVLRMQLNYPIAMSDCSPKMTQFKQLTTRNGSLRIQTEYTHALPRSCRLLPAPSHLLMLCLSHALSQLFARNFICTLFIPSFH